MTPEEELELEMEMGRARDRDAAEAKTALDAKGGVAPPAPVEPPGFWENLGRKVTQGTSARFGDDVAAVNQGIKAVMESGLDDYKTGKSAYDRYLEAYRGTMKSEEAAGESGGKKWPISSFIGELGGAAALTAATGGAGAALTARSGGQLVSPALNLLSKATTVPKLEAGATWASRALPYAKASLVQGAATGAGGAKTLEDVPGEAATSALWSALLGGVAGPTIEKVSSVAAPFMARKAVEWAENAASPNSTLSTAPITKARLKPGGFGQWLLDNGIVGPLRGAKGMKDKLEPLMEETGAGLGEQAKAVDAYMTQLGIKPTDPRWPSYKKAVEAALSGLEEEATNPAVADAIDEGKSLISSQFTPEKIARTNAKSPNDPAPKLDAIRQSDLSRLLDHLNRKPVPPDELVQPKELPEGLASSYESLIKSGTSLFDKTRPITDPRSTNRFYKDGTSLFKENILDQIESAAGPNVVENLRRLRRDYAIGTGVEKLLDTQIQRGVGNQKGPGMKDMMGGEFISQLAQSMGLDPSGLSPIAVLGAWLMRGKTAGTMASGASLLSKGPRVVSPPTMAITPAAASLKSANDIRKRETEERDREFRANGNFSNSDEEMEKAKKAFTQHGN